MLRIGQNYYCETAHDVDLIMQLLEKKQFKWYSGRDLRSQYQNAPIIYCIHSDHAITCSRNPDQEDISTAIRVKNIQNKIISELRR